MKIYKITWRVIKERSWNPYYSEEIVEHYSTKEKAEERMKVIKSTDTDCTIEKIEVIE